MYVVEQEFVNLIKEEKPIKTNIVTHKEKLQQLVLEYKNIYNFNKLVESSNSQPSAPILAEPIGEQIIVDSEPVEYTTNVNLIEIFRHFYFLCYYE